MALTQLILDSSIGQQVTVIKPCKSSIFSIYNNYEDKNTMIKFTSTEVEKDKIFPTVTDFFNELSKILPKPNLSNSELKITCNSDIGNGTKFDLHMNELVSYQINVDPYLNCRISNINGTYENTELFVEGQSKSINYNFEIKSRDKIKNEVTNLIHNCNKNENKEEIFEKVDQYCKFL